MATDQIEGAQRPRFLPYPEYRDTSIEWLGEIPAHWDIQRTKFAAMLRSGHTPSRQNSQYWEDCTIPWFGLSDVWQIRDGEIEYVHDTAENISELGLANSAARLLPKDTVILSRTASVGFSAILGVDMATTQDFVNWICGSSLRPEYLLYVFRAMEPEFRRLTMGSTHQTIYMHDVSTFVTPIPSRVEQYQIVAFIRRETAKIDALVARKERLVKLLQEKRIALITRAVTRGLDPNVPMKDSGVEWLGEIPAHWNIRRIAMAVNKITNGYVGPTRDTLVDDGIPYLQSLHIKNGKIDFDRKHYFVTEHWSERHQKSVLREGDVLVVQTGDIGQNCAVPPTYVGANCHALIILSLKPHLGEGTFLSLLLQSTYGQNALKSSQTGALHPHLECGHVREIPIVLPPREEQRQTVKAVEQELKSLDCLHAKVLQAISHLRELRTTLISDAVTGKIDVRKCAP